MEAESSADHFLESIIALDAVMKMQRTERSETDQQMAPQTPTVSCVLVAYSGVLRGYSQLSIVSSYSFYSTESFQVKSTEVVESIMNELLTAVCARNEEPREVGVSRDCLLCQLLIG